MAESRNNLTDVFNAREAAEFLGVHVETIRRHAKKGTLPGFKVGSDWRFLKDALLRWAESHHLRTQSAQILVIDDDEAVITILSRILKVEGHEIISARDGKQGLKILDSVNVNLIVLDLMMPVMNGPEFLEELRKTNPTLPVIILTGYPDSELMTQAMRHAPVLPISKPVERELLIRTVSLALGDLSLAKTDN